MSKLKLYDHKGSFKFHADISQVIDRGGEGSIIPHPKDKAQVLKIYHDGIKPNLTYQSWIDLNQLDDRFIKPIELLYYSSGEIAGFSMKLLDKSYFRISQLFTKAQCEKMGITDTVKTIIAKELISLIAEAHNKNIVIGDFNPYNIFFDVHGKIRLIDVDSFETPALKHSGRQLDEIRDHYYLGAVNKESDYYALAVNTFRLLTYVHPYKGIHKTCKQLEERAIKRLSVLSNDPDLIIPAFYEPVVNKDLESQFRRIFNEGERFLIQVDQLQVRKIHKVHSPVIHTDVSIKIIADKIIDSYFNESLGYVKTETGTELFDCSLPGNLNHMGRIDSKDYDYLWLGNKNIITIRNNKLFHKNNLIANFEITENFRFIQMEHLLFGVDWDNLYQIFPDKIISNNILWNKTPTWGRGFRFEQHPMQLTGGVARVHFRNGDSINSVKLPRDAKTLVLHGNIGVITDFEKEKIRHNWFQIKGLDLEMGRETNEVFSFAVRQNGNHDFVFVPKDGVIEVLRTPDFAVVDSVAFKECTSQSIIFLTHAGLLLLENKVLYLLNRK